MSGYDETEKEVTNFPCCALFTDVQIFPKTLNLLLIYKS